MMWGQAWLLLEEAAHSHMAQHSCIYTTGVCRRIIETSLLAKKSLYTTAPALRKNPGGNALFPGQFLQKRCRRLEDGKASLLGAVLISLSDRYLYTHQFGHQSLSPSNLLVSPVACSQRSTSRYHSTYLLVRTGEAMA